MSKRIHFVPSLAQKVNEILILLPAISELQGLSKRINPSSLKKKKNRAAFDKYNIEKYFDQSGLLTRSSIENILRSGSKV